MLLFLTGNAKRLNTDFKIFFGLLEVEILVSIYHRICMIQSINLLAAVFYYHPIGTEIIVYIP